MESKRMKTANSFGIYFNLRSEKKKDGKAPVYACITVNSRKIFFAIKQKIAVNCWDENRGCGKNNTTEGKKLNTYLDEIRQALNDCYKELQVQRKVITPEIIKAAYLRTLIFRRSPNSCSCFYNGRFAG
jgi:hypothetical protein